MRKSVVILCLAVGVVFCEHSGRSDRWDRFGRHFGDSYPRGHVLPARGHSPRPQLGSDSDISDNEGHGYNLVGGLEDVNTINDVDMGNVDDSDDVTSRRYVTHHRRPSTGRERLGLRRRHHGIVKRQVLDEAGEEDEDLTRALTRRRGGRHHPQRHGQRRHPSRHARRRQGRVRHPWWEGLGLGRRFTTGVWRPSVPRHGQGHHVNFQFGGEGGMQFGFSSFGGLSSIFGFGPDHWTKGENVCKSTHETVQRHESELSFGIRTMSSRCQDKTTLYVCTTVSSDYRGQNTTVVTQRCCNGFTREPDDMGCPVQLDQANMTQVIKNVNASEFVKALSQSMLNFTLTAPNMTVFAPTNHAMSSYKPDSMELSNYIVLSLEEQEQVITESQRLIEGHIVDEMVLTTNEMYNDQLIETLHPDSMIRINKYPNEVITANCARLIKKDRYARTGVVHLVDHVLVQERGTLHDWLRQNQQVSMFFAALSNTSLARQLRNTDSVFTIFAPNNDAFAKMKPDMRRRLLRDGDGNCVSNVLSAHVLPKTWCSAGLTNGTTAQNLIEQDLHFTRDAEENLYVNGIPVIVQDYVTQNGVIHIISDVMTTAAVAMDLAEENGASHIVSLFNAAEMVAQANDMQNATFFLPTDEALEAISPDELDALRANDDKLRELLKFHIVDGAVSSSELRNGNHLATRADCSLTVTETVARPSKRRFRDRAASTTPMRNIQCAKIVSEDHWTCNGKTVVHLIDRVLLPPVGSILDVIKQNELSSSLFLDMVRRAGFTNLLNKRDQSDLTLFLPTNQALEVMPTRLKTSLNDVENLKNFVKGHLVNASICCSSARNEYWGATVGLRNLNGHVLPWRQRGVGDDVMIGLTPVQVCDISATNGIVHVIEGYIVRRPRMIDYYQNEFDDLFDNINLFD